MDLCETRFEEVTEVYEEWQIKDKLWQGIKLWNELSNGWEVTSFASIDVNEVTVQTDKFAKVAAVCVINMKGN